MSTKTSLKSNGIVDYMLVHSVGAVFKVIDMLIKQLYIIVFVSRWSILYPGDHRYSKAPLPKLLGSCPACCSPVAEQHWVWSRCRSGGGLISSLQASWPPPGRLHHYKDL